MSVQLEKAAEKIALFFYFCFMDESRALAASGKAFRLYSDRVVGEKLNSDVQVIRACYKVLSSQKDFGSVSHIGFAQGNIEFPKGSNWGPWFEFRKSADVDVYAAVILVKVLGFTVTDVAEALNVTDGTVRHRLSRALRGLGQFVQGEARR